jgi:hypothetical protein
MLKKLLTLLIALTLFQIFPQGTLKSVSYGDQGSYLVVVAPGLGDAITKWTEHRTSQGFSVKVVFSNDIIVPSSGVPATTQLWRYVKDNIKKLKLSHLLLIGETKDIPMARLYAARNVDYLKWGEPGPVYSDFYYAQYDKEWDKDGDGRLGEPIDDDVPISPKLAVGRIPFSNSALVEKIMNRIVASDSSPRRKTALQASAIYSFDKEDGDTTNLFTDGAVMQDRIWNDILKPANFIRKTLNECEGIKPGRNGDACLTSTSLLHELTSTDYGIVNWLAHGETNRIVRKFWLADDNGNGYPESKLLDKELKQPLLLDDGQLENANLKSRLIISTACSTADVAGGASSLGAGALRAGACSFVGATAINYFTPGWAKPQDAGNQTISYYLTQNYIDGETIGWALQNTLKAFEREFKNLNGWQEKYLQNIYSYILLGDPGMKQEPVVPKINLQLGFYPNSLNILSGKTGETRLVFGEGSPIFALSLGFQAVPGISLTFNPTDPLPSQDVKITVRVERFVIPGKYPVIITCESKQYKGRGSFNVFVKAPPPSSTELKLIPDYSYVAPKQEFWVDLLVVPSQPVDTFSAQLEFDSEYIEFVKLRLGDFPTQDYRCPESPRALVKKDSVIFSFARNYDKYGISSMGIAFSFCFRGKKVGKSDIMLNLPVIRSPDYTEHVVSDLPITRANISQTGFQLTTSISDDYISNTQSPFVEGVSAIGQTLIIDGLPTPHKSDGKYQAKLNLQRYTNDIVFKIEDSINGRSLYVRRKITWSTSRELCFHLNEKKAWNNGFCEELPQPPISVSGNTLIPLRYIGEKLGFTVTYTADEKRIDLFKNDVLITVWVDKKIGYIDGKEYVLAVAPTVVHGSTFVPLRFVSEAIGCKVTWDATTRTVIVFADLNK